MNRPYNPTATLDKSRQSAPLSNQQIAIAFDATVRNRRFNAVSPDFIDDLLQALKRVVPPNTSQMKDILIISGMPEATENLRYLGFNRQIIKEDDRTLEFSAVAVINNRRTSHWQLGGYREKISRIVFSSRWTRNPMDFFMNSVRCDPGLMDILARAPGNYSLLGILQVEKIAGSGLIKRKPRHVRPVIAVPGIGEEDLKKVITFEKANEIGRSKLKGLSREPGKELAGTDR